MWLLDRMLDSLTSATPMAVTAVAVVLIIVIVRYLLAKQNGVRTARRYRIQLATMLLSLLGLVSLIVASPLGDTSKGQLLSLIGILLSAAIALSSTTLLGNAMAGVMLRTIRSFRAGDFLSVRDNFGRVTELGLFHTEIQAEDSNLVTLPNLYLVTNPVKVLRSTGTIISAKVSLGYDISRARIERLLLTAAEQTGLKDPFVYVLNLDDFSVSYQISGMLTEVTHVLSTRSRLRQMILDCLHEDGVEIVSPTFMNQRRVELGDQFVPPLTKDVEDSETAAQRPEDIVFDKAAEAESIERLRERYETLEASQAKLKEELKATDGETQQQEMRDQIKLLDKRKERIVRLVEKKEQERNEPPDVVS